MRNGHRRARARFVVERKHAADKNHAVASLQFQVPRHVGGCTLAPALEETTLRSDRIAFVRHDAQKAKLSFRLMVGCDEGALALPP